jgi:hypothetical protein
MLMKRSLACIGALLGLGALAAGMGAAADAPQVLPRPGVDARPQDSRIVEPVPLPVSGTVQVVAAANLPVHVVGAEGAPLRVQVVNPPQPAPGVPVEQGRCYSIDLEGAAANQPLSRIEEVRGSWLRVRVVRGAAPGERAVSWINATRALRISEAVACE